MRKIALAGFGMEGRAAYKYLRGSAEIEIFDDKEVDMVGIDAPFRLGLSIPADFDLVYKTPGIPTSKLRLASASTKVTTLMDDVIEKVGKRAVGVTGTKGKSTVASLIHHILKSTGKPAELFGNIGIADMTILDTAPADAVFVIEMSSYQCEHITHSPHIAILTNLFPEHLSHHGSFEAYRDAKMRIKQYQGPADLFIDGRTIAEGEPFTTQLLGAHNQKNCAIALAAVHALGVSEIEARTHIATFQPLPGRLENVGMHGGITFYDDFLATIPEATLAAIEALGKVDTIILGGEDRGIPFEEFAKNLAKTNIQNFIIFPDTGPKMVTMVKDRNVVAVTTMEAAARAAYEHTPKGGVVLLSNASPSFNLFKDYKDKSAQYRKWIKDLGVSAKLG